MKALTFGGARTIRHESLPDPVIHAPTDAIVKVRLAAICGSDLHVYHGRETGLDAGTIMGHEFAGEVVEVGGAVGAFKEGDPVFGPFSTNCGECFYCRSGLTSRCPAGMLFGWVQDGIGLEGAQAEYLRVPLADSTLLQIPAGVEPEVALLLGDALSTGYFCAELAEVGPEGTYAVIGCGTVGQMAIVGAHDLGARRIYCIDAISARLGLAESFGAVPINYEEEDPIQVLRQATSGRGADAVLEVVGSESAAKLAFDLVRPGGIIAAIGVHAEERFSFTPGQAYDTNLTYKTGRCPARHYMERLLPLAAERRFPLTSVITHRLPLGEGARGYEIFDRKLDGCIKVVLEP